MQGHGSYEQHGCLGHGNIRGVYLRRRFVRNTRISSPYCKKMLNTSLETMGGRGCRIIRSYIEPDNFYFIRLQKAWFSGSVIHNQGSPDAGIPAYFK